MKNLNCTCVSRRLITFFLGIAERTNMKNLNSTCVSRRLITFFFLC